MRRAQGLQIPPFAQSPESNGSPIPCVQGVGGSQLYLVEAGTQSRIWDTEFVPIPGALVSADAGLLRIDHVAQTMQYEEMLSWLLYYVSLFDVAKAPLVQIADPLGLVQSQAIESPEGGLRITLNGSASSHTLSARFLQGFHGAGVQHIALASADIFASARRLRELGLAMLPIPRNYYEDLAARFGLEETLLTQLAEFNILYDRDTDGEYFHLVSRAFAKRFFFEVVERRGYRAYGAANASIRLAAQSRYRDDLDQ
jgi:4-hydroxyphenylpyruvate dioxygenase